MTGNNNNQTPTAGLLKLCEARPNKFSLYGYAYTQK